MSDLSDKVVLIITEAGSAIGAATATLFARLGAKLSLADRNEVNLQRVADECARVGSEQPLMVVADLSCEPDVTNLVDTTVKKFGRLDILVNNAGQWRPYRWCKWCGAPGPTTLGGPPARTR